MMETTEYISRQDEITAVVPEEIFKKALMIPMPKYLKDALMIMNDAFNKKIHLNANYVHNKLRLLYPGKYQILDYRYSLKFGEINGLRNIAMGINTAMKRANVPLRLRQDSLRMYRTTKNYLGSNTYHFIEIKKAT